MFQQLKNGEVLQPIVKEVEARFRRIHKEIDERIEDKSISGITKLSKTSSE